MRRALIASIIVALVVAALVGGIALSTGWSGSDGANPIQRLIRNSGDENEPDENESGGGDADEAGAKASRNDGEGESAGDEG